MGIVGAGLIWDLSHKLILKKLNDVFEIAAFAVRSDKNHDKLNKEYPHSRVFRDYRELLELDDLDAVIVLTPIHLNAAVTMAALAAGKHVLVEKPLATNLDDVERIIRLEKETKKKVLVLEQFRYDDRLKILKRALDDGRIGDVVSYELVDHGKIDDCKYYAGGYGTTEWRIDPEFPLGSLFDRGIHRITELSYLFPKPESVYALGSQIRSGFGQYDHILMTFAHPGGIHGTFSFADYLDGADNYFFIRGTTGTIRFRPDGLNISGDPSGRVDLPESDNSLIMWKQCAAWFSAPETPVYGSKESQVDISMLVAVDASIRQRRAVALK